MKKLNFLAIMLLSSLLVTGCNSSGNGTTSNTNTSISDIYESHNISFSTSESYIVHCELSSAKKMKQYLSKLNYYFLTYQ